MDHENQKPTPIDHSTSSQPVQPLVQTEINEGQQSKPDLKMTDGEARALLAMKGLQASERKKAKVPTKLIIAIAALVIGVILVSYLLGALKPGSTHSSSSNGIGLPNQSNSGTGNSTTNQINQDVKACSNGVNALTVC
jgi:hypothetical protein